MHVYDHYTPDNLAEPFALTMRQIDARAIGTREYPDSKLSEIAYEAVYQHPAIVWC